MLSSRTFRLVAVIVVVMVSSVLGLAQDDVGAEPVVQSSTVHSFSDGSQIDDAFARLTRYENGVTMVISTNDLAEAEVYTVWWVIFNAPENCSNDVCDADDILVLEDGEVQLDEAGNRALNMEGIEAAQVSLMHAAGGYATDGALNTSATLAEGDAPGSVLGPGLVDAQTAEIHLVVRTHGPAIEDVLADQISTFGGGCEPIDAPPCVDVQFAVFEPPM